MDVLGDNNIQDDNEAEEDEVDWNAYTVKKLKEEVETHDLPFDGKKTDLVERLTVAASADEEAEEEPVD